MAKSPTYVSWDNMISRCTRPSCPAFEHYRNRGIGICERWLTYANFLADMGDRPQGLTIERIDNEGNYEPSNCRWATKREQANNRVTNVRFDYRGRSFTLAELARHTGTEKDLLRDRLIRKQRGQWTVESAIAAPRQKGRRFDHGMSIRMA